jgi:holo-[acyl-carrier protein] synthase
VGVGTDLVRIARIAEAMDRHPGFAARLFTPAEIAYCERHREPGARYAARFAAKEAVLKALGTGLARGMRWQDVEIVSAPNGRPLVRLHGAVAATARAQGITSVELSLAHEGEYALAFAVTQPLLGAPAADEAAASGRAR